jgi:hypothetical protein
MNVMLISFMNLGIMVLLINMQLDHSIPVPVFKGRFDEFSVEWYKLVGSAMCVQLMLLVVSTNVSNLGFAFMASVTRFLDRGCCCCGSWRTKKLTLEDYQQVNTGSAVDFDYKYANLLTVVYLTMLYGSGIPIMYLIAAVYFFVSYWIDKVLIYYNHRKPNEFNETLTLQVLRMFKYAVIMHIVGALFMYSNSSILPVTMQEGTNDTTVQVGSKKYKKHEDMFSGERYNSLEMNLYIFFIFLTFVAYLIDMLFVRQIRKCLINCSEKAKKELTVEEVDFAAALSSADRKNFENDLQEMLEATKQLPDE